MKTVQCLLILCVLLSGCGQSSSTSNGSPGEIESDPAAPSENEPPLSPASESAAAGALEQGDAELILKFTLEEDATLIGSFHVPDNEPSQAVAFASLPLNGALTIRPDGNSFRYVPDLNYWGDDSFSYETASGQQIIVELLVDAVNDAPTFTTRVVPTTIRQGRLFRHELTATDVDNEPLFFTASKVPAWLILDSATGQLSGIPGQSDVGTVTDVAFRVADSEGLSDQLVGITLDVVDINDAPTINLSQAPSEMYARKSVSFESFPTDIDGDSIKVQVYESDVLTAKVSDTGVITLTADDVKTVSTREIIVTAEDDFGAFTEEKFAITVFPRTKSGRGITLSGAEEGAGIHVVFMSDGYTKEQLASFRQHVVDAVDNIESDEGIGNHLGAFNFHYIETPSNDSGADDTDAVDIKDTAFDATYGCRSIQRLICANTLKLFQSALDEYAVIDQMILLVNDGRYGGSGNSGGRIAIASAFWSEIALHEMGHSLADLADEYVDSSVLGAPGTPPFVEGRYANVSLFSDPDRVPWKHWLDRTKPIPQADGEAGVGVFEGGSYRPFGVWRSGFETRMRNYSSSFGPVNSEQWILRLYTLTEGIRDLFPKTDNLDLSLGQPQTFSVDPIFGLQVQTVQWLLNGELLDVAGDPTTITLELPAGEHTVLLDVRDNTGAIRLPPPHAGIFTRTWKVRVQ